jgi:hypothetical protein
MVVAAWACQPPDRPFLAVSSASSGLQAGGMTGRLQLPSSVCSQPASNCRSRLAWACEQDRAAQRTSASRPVAVAR